MGPLDELRFRLAEGSDLRLAAGVLGWDQRVTMPPRGTDSRAEQLATLGRIAHERFVDPEVGRLLDACEPLVEGLPYDEVAERLDIRPAAARLRVSRALGRLRQTTTREIP